MKRGSHGSTAAVRLVTVDAEHAGQRIDNFLRGYLKGVPKTRIYRGLRKGEVRVNKGRVRQNYKVQEGDQVRIPPLRTADTSSKAAPAAERLRSLEAAIVFESRELLVLNKPSGWAVHGGSGQSYGVIEGLRALRPDERYLELAHRLDRDTSGCLLVARRRSALTSFHAALRAGEVNKEYIALVSGKLQPARQTIDLPLRKQVLRSGERMVEPDPSGKPALTKVSTVDHSTVATLVRARILTGRTHQIRVHLAACGHPLAGDTKYGDTAFNQRCRDWGLRRLFLHAEHLSFKLDGVVHSFRAPLPAPLARLISTLGLTLLRPAGAQTQ